MTPTAKKLIEVAMPIKEISAESVRDKSIRHGHISTLHLWWARRPLPVCRAVVFASLVPDPLDPNCPPAFREAVELLLGSPEKPLYETGMLVDAYKPYRDIPWTAVHDPMDDNPRNRLQMFIGKFTEEMQEALLQSKPSPAAGKLLSNNSLIKWDNKNNENIINKARKLIFVAHNSTTRSLSEAERSEAEKNAEDLLAEFDTLYSAIKTAEKELYALPDRHLDSEDCQLKTANLHTAIEDFLNKMPKVFDPFAGGGAIPLEAARLGCRSYGNDINPVAHIIQKGSLEFPQKYGKPINYGKDEFIKLYGRDELLKWCKENGKHPDNENLKIEIPNRLSFDVAFYAKKLLNETEKEIGHLYPVDAQGKKPIAYYWARVGNCSNPSCRAEVPLLKQFYLANTTAKQVYLKPIIEGTKIEFEIKKGKYNENELEGWLDRGNMKCPCCGNATDVKTLKKQFIEGKIKEKIIAVIWDSTNGKDYQLPTEVDLAVIAQIPTDTERPKEPMSVEYTQALPCCTWGLEKWGDMFSLRQLYALQTLVKKLHELKQELKHVDENYQKAVVTYLGILLDRVAQRQTSFGVWDTTRENLQAIFGKQAVPMMFDYPESNPFSSSGGSALNQLDWLTRYIESECDYPFSVSLQNASSGEKEQFKAKEITAVVTDPPYYDAIAYADLSDFFYVWLKRTLGDIYPLNFATPQTPKTEECTALKHHRNNSKTEAKDHFEYKLTQIFDAIEHQTSDIVSIMFAHQSTEAWTTLCNSILGSRMNITGSWATDTEMTGALKTGKAFLSSSVTVSCKPAQRKGFGAYKEVKREIEKTVEREVGELYRLGFRGADLLTACFGQAVSEFGKYEKVEKADGSEITVAELLEMARESAFNALLKGFDGDDFTKFYIGWLQLYGFAESDFDDAAKFSRVGLSINVNELFTEHLLIKKGNKQTLGNFEERMTLNKNLGKNGADVLIDQVHRAMHLYQGNRSDLVEHIANVADSTEKPFWRVLTSILELLPAGCTDYKQASGLLSNRDSLIRESKLNTESKVVQGNLFQ